jgi:hypothetical protein
MADRIKQCSDLVRMQNRVVFPLLIFRSVESSVLGVAFVKNAPVGTPFLDACAFERCGSYFPPATCMNRNGLDARIDVAELTTFLREPSMPGIKGSMAASPIAAPLPGVPRFFHIQGHSFGCCLM